MTEPNDLVAASIERRQYAEYVYRAEHDRYGWLEEKAARYIVNLSLIFSAIGLIVWPELSARAKIPGIGWFELLWQSAALTSIGFTVRAFQLSIAAMRPQEVPHPPLDKVLFEAFDLNGYTLADLRNGFATRYREAAETLRHVNDERADLLEKAVRLMIRATIGLVATAMLQLAVIRWS